MQLEHLPCEALGECLGPIELPTPTPTSLPFCCRAVCLQCSLQLSALLYLKPQCSQGHAVVREGSTSSRHSVASVLQHTPSPKVTCKVREKTIILKYLKYVHRSSQLHQSWKKKKKKPSWWFYLFCNSGKFIRSFITVEREYKEDLGVPSCGVSCYYHLATKSH